MSGSGINVKAMTPLNWVTVGSVAFIFIALFFESYAIDDNILDYGVNGWHWAGFWVPYIFLALPAAAIVAVTALRADLVPANIPVSPRLVSTSLLGLAMLIMLIRSMTFPGGDDASWSYGTVFVLLAIVAAVVSAALSFKASGDKLPKIPGRPA